MSAALQPRRDELVAEARTCPRCQRVVIVCIPGAQVAHRCPRDTQPRRLTTFTNGAAK